MLNSNTSLNSTMLLQSVEAARECGMACVVVAGRNPLYELTAADLVVKQLQELSFVNLKQLFGRERRVDPRVSWACVHACNLPSPCMPAASQVLYDAALMYKFKPM